MGMFVHADTESTHDDHSMFCHYTADKAQPIQQAPKPRFTADERDALNCVCYLATALFDVVEGQDKTYDKRFSQSITTVKKMLEEVTP